MCESALKTFIRSFYIQLLMKMYYNKHSWCIFLTDYYEVLTLRILKSINKLLNLPFCWQQNVFSSLQSKSVFSYLFSLTFIQKQFSDISFGPICNGRKVTPNSWAGPITAHRSGSPSSSRCLWSQLFQICPQRWPSDRYILQNTEVL